MFWKGLAASITLIESVVIASPAPYPSNQRFTQREDGYRPDKLVVPAKGPSFIFNDTSVSHVDLQIDSVQAYALQESYDSSNWFSKFTVENVCSL